ncbi:hypothetical protein V8E36_004658 [Tilletia maclaganii]
MPTPASLIAWSWFFSFYSTVAVHSLLTAPQQCLRQHRPSRPFTSLPLNGFEKRQPFSDPQPARSSRAKSSPIVPPDRRHADKRPALVAPPPPRSQGSQKMIVRNTDTQCK